jgi:hypothetical protein
LSRRLTRSESKTQHCNPKNHRSVQHGILPDKCSGRGVRPPTVSYDSDYGTVPTCNLGIGSVRQTLDDKSGAELFSIFERFQSLSL